MEIILNELSLQNPPQITEVGIKGFTDFITKLENIQKAIKRTVYLRATLELKSVSIANNYVIMQYLKKKPDKLAFFLAITAQKKILRGYPPYYYYKGAECEGLGIAHENGIFAISFNNNNEWNDNNYTLLKCNEIDNEMVEEVCTIKHFGTINNERIKEHLAESNQMQVYDCDSKFSPRDNQTILFDDTKFKFTGKHYTFGVKPNTIKRRIYEHKTDKTYWYVDNLHYGCNQKDGKAAHLEVFSPSKKHIGIADIQTGIINEKYKEDGRILVL